MNGTPEQKTEIVSDIANGVTLAEICRRDHMPYRQTIYDWLAEDEDFARRFARARVTGGHAIAERARLTMRGFGPDDGGDSTGDVQRDKAIADLDLKLLARWFPKDYGERTQLAPTDTAGNDLPIAPIMFVGVEAKRPDDE